MERTPGRGSVSDLQIVARHAFTSGAIEDVQITPVLCRFNSLTVETRGAFNTNIGKKSLFTRARYYDEIAFYE